MKYKNGTFCVPLDVVKVPIIEERPLKYQPENVLIDGDKRWIKTGNISIDKLLEIHFYFLTKDIKKF